MRPYFLSVVVALLSSCALSKLPPPGRIDLSGFRFELRDFRLPNGLRIVVEADHSQPLVTMVSLVGAGAADEPVGKEGLAHFLEHLQFRIKPTGTVKAWRALEQIGATGINAFTAPDETVYFEVAPVEALPSLLQLEGLRLSAPAAGIDQAVFDAEREVVRNELRQSGETSPYGQIFDWVSKAVFPKGHPYARPVVGTHESLSSITQADVAAYAKQHYRPDNITIVITGDVDLDTIGDVLRENLPAPLWVVPPGFVVSKAPRLSGPAKPPPAPTSAFMTREKAAVASPELYLAWPLPRGWSDDSAALEVLAEVATRGLSEASRSDADVVAVNASLIEGGQGSALVVAIPLHEGKHPEQTAQRVLDQLVTLWGVETGTSQEHAAAEREFHQRHLLAVVGMAAAAEDMLTRAVVRAESTHFSGDPVAFTRRSNQRVAVTPVMVQKLAYEYLTRERARAVYVEPLPKDAVPAKDSVGLAQVSGADETIKVTFGAQALAQLARGPGLGGAKSFTLANGLKVMLLPRKGQPLVSVTLGLPTGRSDGPRGGGAVAVTAAHSTSRRYGEPQDHGFLINDAVLTDLTAVEARGLKGNLANMLATLYAHVSSMKIDDRLPEIDHDQYGFIEDEEKDPHAVAQRHHYAALFPGLPYAHVDRVSDMRTAGSSGGNAWLDLAFRPTGAVLVVAGDIEPVAVESLVHEWFDGWTGSATPSPKMIAAVDAHPLTVQLVHRPGATQGEVLVGCRVNASTAEQRASNRVVAAMVSTRLNHRLREELGGSYGFGGEAQEYRGGTGFFEFGGAISNTSLPAALKIIKATWAVPVRTFSTAELTGAQWQLLAGYRAQFRESSTLARSAAMAELVAGDARELDQRPSLWAAPKPETLDAAWSQCQGSVVLTLVGDEATTKSALAAAAYPAPVILKE